MMTEQGKESIRSKLEERLTPERREQFAKETIEARKKAEMVRKEAADDFAKKYGPMILDKQKMGYGLVEIAKQLNNEGHKSRRGAEWTDQTVRQILKRMPKQKPIVLVKPPIIVPQIRKKWIGWDVIG
jgi:hypothetical protein